jgi:tetratricopeptide (TPR) repeat protein
VASTETTVVHLARHLLSIGRSKAALDALARASSDEIESAEYWKVRAGALSDLGRYEASRDTARRGLERNPEDIGLLEAYAVAELNMGITGIALKVLEEALELSPGNPILLAHRAWAFALREDFAEAEAAIEEALRVAPERQHVLQTRAQIACLANDRRAKEYIDDLLRSDPNDPVAHVLSASVAGKSKRLVSAARAWEEAARLDPGDIRVAAAAREARVHAHPLLAPLRLLFYRFGTWPARLLYYAGLVAAVIFLGPVGVLLVWAALGLFLLLSRVGLEVIRRRQDRKHGGF